MYGGHGYIKSNKQEQILRDVRISTVWEGTTQIQVHIYMYILGGHHPDPGIYIYTYLRCEKERANLRYIYTYIYTAYIYTTCVLTLEVLLPVCASVCVLIPALICVVVPAILAIPAIPAQALDLLGRKVLLQKLKPLTSHCADVAKYAWQQLTAGKGT